MDNLNLDQHISRQFNADLDDVKSKMLHMGGLVEKQIALAIHALESADNQLASDVIKMEDKIDELELEIDEECATILARRQPAASDLRLVLAVSRTTTDLERVGDEANKIACMALQLMEGGDLPKGYIEIRHIGDHVREMVKNALDAFARFDVQQALEVVQEDHRVDIEYGTAVRELITYMMEDPRSISRAINILWSLRALERVGDHARNIAEHLIYLVKGKDVRHSSTTEMKKKIEDE